MMKGILSVLCITCSLLAPLNIQSDAAKNRHAPGLTPDKCSFQSGLCAEAAVTGDKDVIDDILGDLEEALPENFEGLSDPGRLSEKITLSELWEEIVRALSGEASYIGGALFTMLGFALLLALAEGQGGALGDTTSAVAHMVCGTALFGILSPVISMVADALSSERELMGALFPIMTAVSTASGAVATAGVQATGYAAVLYIIGYISEPVLLGLVYSMLLLSISGSMSGGVSRLGAGIRSSFAKLLGAVCAAFSGVIALQTVIASAQDNALMRVAKHATGTLIPMVGVGVSGALSTLASGLSYASDIVGGAAVTVILLISLSPVVVLLLLKLALFIAGSLLEFCRATRAASLFSAFDGALSALTSVYVLTTLVCIIQAILFMKGGIKAFG